MRRTLLAWISALLSLASTAGTVSIDITDTVLAPASQMGVNVGNATANFVNGSCFEAAADSNGFASQGWPWWKQSNTFTASVDTATKASGKQSQKIVVATAPSEMKQTRVDLPQAALTTQLIAGNTYIIKARMRAATGSARMKLGFVNESWGTHYPSTATTLTTNWADYSWSFTPSTTSLWRGVTIQFLDADTYWVDDVVAWNGTQTDAETGFQKQYVDRLKELKPKMLRLGGLGVNGVPLEAYLFSPWPASYGPPPTEDLNINVFLALCKAVGAAPFICMPPAFTDTASAATQTDLTWDLINNHYADHGNLVDYIGGEAATAYGLRRQNDGFARWDTQFSAIYYEMGNETWGTPDGKWDMHLAVQPPNTPFAGAPADPWLENYAVYCQKRLTEMKSRTGWRANMRAGFGGFAANTDDWAFYRTKLIPVVKNIADFGTIFMYYGTGNNTHTDEQIYGGLFAKAIWHEREIKAMNAKYKTAAGKDVPCVIYEGNAVWGNYYNGPSDNDKFVYSKEVSLGAAVSLIDNYCAGNKAGVTYNNHFAFTGGPWSTLSDAGYLRKPSFFALKMMNENLGGDLITASVSGSGTWNDGLTSESNVPYVACYPYKNGSALSIVVVNRHRTQAQTVTLRRSMTFRRMVSLTGNNINTNNETAENITSQTQTLSGFGDTYTFSAAPFSAYVLVATDGVPPAAPSGLIAVAASASQIDLAWTDVSTNETRFSLERSSDGQNWLPLATLAANTTAYADTGLTAATLYYYRVKATNDPGESAYTDPASAVTFSSGGGGGDGGGGGGGGSGSGPGTTVPSGDFDGDGIPNASDPDDDGDGIGDALDPEPYSMFAMKLTKVKGAMKFGVENKDACAFSGLLPALPAGFNPENQAVTFNAGGAGAVFTLDAKGRAKNATGSLMLKLKTVRNKTTKKKEFLGGDVPFSVKLSKGTWSDDWADEGVNPAADVKDGTLTISVQLALGGKLYSATATTKYKSKAEKGAGFSATMK